MVRYTNLFDLMRTLVSNCLRGCLEDEADGKVCVVYRHRAILDVLIKALAEYDPAWIKGQMTPDQTSEQEGQIAQRSSLAKSFFYKQRLADTATP